MWIVIFLGGALLTGYALYRQAVRDRAVDSVSSLRTYVSDRVEKSVSCHTQLGRI